MKLFHFLNIFSHNKKSPKAAINGVSSPGTVAMSVLGLARFLMTRSRGHSSRRLVILVGITIVMA